MNSSNILETGMPLRREIPPGRKFDSVILSAGFLYECQSSVFVAGVLLPFTKQPFSAVAATPVEWLFIGTALLWLVFRLKYSLGEHVGRGSLLADRVC